MKISKEDEDKRLTIYQPDDNEKELMGEVSDKIIDLMDNYNLSDDQRIHLISALFVTMKEIYNIEGIKHFDDLDSQSMGGTK